MDVQMNVSGRKGRIILQVVLEMTVVPNKGIAIFIQVMANVAALQLHDHNLGIYDQPQKCFNCHLSVFLPSCSPRSLDSTSPSGEYLQALGLLPALSCLNPLISSKNHLCKKESADALTWLSCTGIALCPTESVHHFGSC